MRELSDHKSPMNLGLGSREMDEVGVGLGFGSLDVLLCLVKWLSDSSSGFCAD